MRLTTFRPDHADGPVSGGWVTPDTESQMITEGFHFVADGRDGSRIYLHPVLPDVYVISDAVWYVRDHDAAPLAARPDCCGRPAMAMGARGWLDVHHAPTCPWHLV